MRRGMTLIEAIVVVAAVCILAAIVLSSTRLIDGHDHRISMCVNNLSQLHKMMQIYRANHRDRFPDARGSAFWLALRKTDPPLIDESMIDIYSCPVKAEDPGPSATDYLGPGGPAGRLLPGDPLGADAPGNHDEKEGINVLRMAGDVRRIHRDDPLWAASNARLSR